MGDYEEQIRKLPAIGDALKLPRDEYYAYANKVYENRDNCPYALFIAEKLHGWCQAMNCLGNLDNCMIPKYVSDSVSPTATIAPSLTTTISNVNKTVGINGTCYDAYFCQPYSITPYLHSFLGIASLTICLIGILFTIIFIAPLNIPINRTSATFYLTMMAIFDVVYMVLFTLIIVIRHLPVLYKDQLEMYASFTVYLIPHGLPTMQMMELYSVWLTVALLVDRFLYLKLGFHSKLIYSRLLSIKTTIVVIIMLTIYTVPKYLEYKLIFHSKVGMKVIYTSVRDNESFKNLLLHWLKVPIEMFLPYLAIAIFAVLNSIKFYDLMFKKKITANRKTNKKLYNCDTNNDTIGNDNNMSNGADLNSLDPIGCTGMELDINTMGMGSFKLPTINIASRQPLLSSSLKSFEDRENLNVIVGLIIGFSLLALKVPKFVLHALKSESYVADSSTRYFQPVTDFLDLSWIILRPLIYLTIASHYRASFLYVYYCCSGRNICCYDSSINSNQSEDSNELKKKSLDINLEEVANEYLKNEKMKVDNVNDQEDNKKDSTNPPTVSMIYVPTETNDKHKISGEEKDEKSNLIKNELI